MSTTADELAFVVVREGEEATKEADDGFGRICLFPARDIGREELTTFPIFAPV